MGRSDGREAKAFEEFWSWWSGAKDRVAQAIGDRTIEGLVAEISGRVNALDKAMAWELAKGQNSRHAFCLSPEGNAETRPIALRWLASAPAADATWEYHASRQPHQLGRLLVGGQDIELEEMRAIADWEDSRELLNVRLSHPAFASVPKQASMQIAFLFLDGLLGEDCVERWIGKVDVSEEPFAGRTPTELKSEVERCSAAATRDKWGLAQRADRKGTQAIVLANTALKRIDFPFASTLVVVSIGLGIEQLSKGKPSGLDEAEDELTEALEKTGAAYAGRVTERSRRLFYFVAAEGEAATKLVEFWAKAHKAWSPRLEVKNDPKWTFRTALFG